MPEIAISVTAKKAVISGTPEIICGNSDYTITWTLDSEWTSLTDMTAHFEYWGDNGIRYAKDVSFTGSSCSVPVLDNIDRVFIMLYAGDIHTSSPVCVPCIRTVTQKEEAPPSPDPPTPVGEMLYGNIETDSSAQSYSVSEVYSMSTQSDLEDAKTWIEAHCPASLGATVSIGSYTAVGGRALRCSFGDLQVQPDSLYKNIRIIGLITGTSSFGSVNEANAFRVICTGSHIIFQAGYQSSSFSPSMHAVVTKDKDGNVCGIAAYHEYDTYTTQLQFLTAGLTSVVVLPVAWSYSPMTILYKAPCPASDPSVFDNLYISPLKETGTAADAVYSTLLGQAKLNDIKYLQVNTALFIPL